MPMEEVGTYRIALDGEWSFWEFHELPRAYTQVYSLVYVLNHPPPATPFEEDYEEGVSLLGSFPWRGGYSAVNFYNEVMRTVPRAYRPRVTSIQYGSPGHIDLAVALTVSGQVTAIVVAVATSATLIASTYHKIYKGLHDRKLMRISAKRQQLALSRDQLLFVKESTASMVELMGLPSSAILDPVAPNPLARLKLLLSLYRRVRLLVAYKRRGKADF